MLLTRDKLIEIIELTETKIGSHEAADRILAILGAEEPDWGLQVFPDEERLKHRRAAFLSKLVAYLSPAGRVESDGGWTKVTREDVEEFRWFVTELRDLRYGLDPDRDPTIEIALVNRINGRMHTFYEPYAPDHKERETPPSLEEWAEYRDNIMGKASHMVSAAGRMLDMMRRNETRDLEEAKRQRLGEDALLTLKTVIPHVSFDVAKSYYTAMIVEFGINGDATKKAREMLGDAIINDTVIAAAGMDSAIDSGDMEDAANLIVSGQNLWFGGAFAKQRKRWNDIAYVTRRKAKREQTTAPAWSNGFIFDYTEEEKGMAEK